MGIFISCAQRIKIPVNRFITPQTIGGGGEFEIRQQTLTEGLLDFSNGDIDNPLLMGTANQRGMGLAASLGKSADLSYSVPFESASILAIKVQVLGGSEKAKATGHQLAVSLGMGAERDTYEGDYEIKMKYDLSDYAVIHGYSFGNIVIYEGLAYSNYKFRGKITSLDELNGSNITYVADNTLTLYGGVFWHNFPIKAKLEFGVQSVEWTNTPRTLYYGFGYSFGITW